MGTDTGMPKEQFVDRLVYGVISPEETSESLARLGLRGEPTFVVCLGLPGYSAMDARAQEKARRRIVEIAASVFPGSIVAFLHQNCCYAIGRLAAEADGLRRELQDRASRVVERAKPLKAVAGVAPAPEGAKDLNFRARNAVVAHRYDLVYPARSVFRVEDLDASKFRQNLEVRERAVRLVGLVRVGDAAKAGALAESMARDIAFAYIDFLDGLRFELLTMVFSASHAALEARVPPGKVVFCNGICLRQIAGLHDLRDLIRTAAGAVADLASLAAEAVRQERSPIVTAAKEYLRRHFAEPITLVELARQVHSSAYHFSRTFKAQEGMSFVEFLNGIRVEKAKSLLADPSRRVTDVCFDVGFNNLNHFTRIFRRIAGSTPSAYRRRLRS